MLDKISNQKLFFISLIGIVVTSMILTTTFAYQSIRVNYSEGADSEVSINAGTLDVKYCRNDECVDPNESENNYNKISVDNLSFLPDYKTASYVEFVVDNRSSSDDVAYMITLSDLVYNKMFVSEAFKYTVVVVNEDSTLTEIITDNFSTLTGDSFDLNLEDRIYKYIEKGKTEKVRIYLWLDENVDVQLDLSDAGEACLEATDNSSSRCFKGTVNVSSIFEGEIANPLLYRKLINSAKLAALNNDNTRTVYNDTFDLNNITGISNENDKMLALAEDDYGTSYVYRGAVKDNYVNFAGFTWQIVRINGDNSIRLILEEPLDSVKKIGESDYVYTNSKLLTLDIDGLIPFNEIDDDNAYVGYMYGDFVGESTSYDEAHTNIKDSTIKKYIDAFYEEYLKNYQDDYLEDSLFCANKTRFKGYIEKGYGKLGSYYSKYFDASQTSNLELKCILNTTLFDSNLTKEQYAYSRYTSSIDSNTETIQNVFVNNDLKYPIALLSGDELTISNGAINSNNISDWWTITPSYFKQTHAYVRVVKGKQLSNRVASLAGRVRPVINLKSSLLWNSGDGTKDKPYEVMLSE